MVFCLDTTWFHYSHGRKVGRGRRNTKRKVHESQTQTQHSHQNRHHQPRRLNARVCENTRYFRSILTFMLKRFCLSRKMMLSQIQAATTLRRRYSWPTNAQRQLIPIAHLLFLSVLEYDESPQTSLEMILLVELVREKCSKHSGREHPSPLCA